jgi:hypothetical protein
LHAIAKPSQDTSVVLGEQIRPACQKLANLVESASEALECVYDRLYGEG